MSDYVNAGPPPFPQVPRGFILGEHFTVVKHRLGVFRLIIAALGSLLSEHRLMVAFVLGRRYGAMLLLILPGSFFVESLRVKLSAQ